VPGQPFAKCLPPTTTTARPARKSSDGPRRPRGCLWATRDATLRELAGGDVYSLTLAEVERCAKGGVPDPLHREVVKLYQQVEERGLIELFRTGPDLSEVHPDDILTLASFSDVRPDAKTMFRTADAVFMRLVDLSKQGPVVVTKLILDDFCLLAVLAIYFPEAWESLRTLAEGPSWTADMLAVDRDLAPVQPLQMVHEA